MPARFPNSPPLESSPDPPAETRRGLSKTASAVADSALDQSNLPIFNQDWWVAIARGAAEYREVRIVEGITVLGRLPFVVSRNHSFCQAHDPYWSHLGGPIIDERLSRSAQAEVAQRLVAKFPRWCSGYFVCNPNSSYADLVRDAFQRAGFEHSTQITYVRYPTDAPVTAVRKGKHNGHIRRASQKLDCVEIGAGDFVRFYEANLQARTKASYAPLEIVARLTGEALRRGQARAIAARRKDFDAHGSGAALYDAAIVYVWDQSRCYYWMSTHRPHSQDSAEPKPHPDATKFLAMNAMQHAQRMNLIFDADGVTTPGSENLYRNMFGLQTEERRDVFQRITAWERFVRNILRKTRQWLPKAA